MLYNIKTLPLHCVFHGIRFKVNKDWVSGKIPFFFCVCTPSFFFCTNKRKTKQKENSLSAFFYLLQHFSPLNKKNSLRSNSFLFLTLQKALPLHGKKKRTDLYLLWGGLTLLRSFLGMRVKELSLRSLKWITPTSEAMFILDEIPAFSSGTAAGSLSFLLPFSFC